MSMNDFAKRLKVLSKKASELRQKETINVKLNAKYNGEMTKLLVTIRKSRKQLRILQEEVRKEQASIQTLSKFTCECESTNKGIKQEIVILQERNNASNTMHLDRLRCLKDLTKTYIDLRSLPQSIEAVTVCEKENSNQCVSFHIDPASHTQEEVQSKIWENESIKIDRFEHEWHNLFFCNFQFEE